jgi:ParB/RepB/Spo0J family partition protein
MSAAADQVGPILTLPTASIHPSARNPRRSFDAASDAELLESIRQHGILTPLLVRPIDDWHGDDLYEIVAGHRRYAAARELGLEGVPVTIRELTDEQAHEAALIENLQREDLAPLDEAAAFQTLLAREGQTPATVAAAVGKSPAYVSRRIKLLTLVPEAQTALRDGALGVAHAELLVRLTPDLQTTALGEAVWMPLFRRERVITGPPSATDPRPEAHHLLPIADLREWVERHTKLDLADQEALALFPDAAKIVTDIAARSTISPIAPPLEVALDRFGMSPARASIPAGVLRLHKDFRQVVGKKCTFARRAIVVFGQARGDVVTVCTARKSCTTHWPPKAKPDPAKKAAPRPSWEAQEAERKRVATIWARVKPDVQQVLVKASARIKTTPKLLQAILEDGRGYSVEVLAAIGGRLTLDNFGRAWVLSGAFADLWDVQSAERALKDVGAFFDIAKAMRAAEAALAAESGTTPSAAKTTTTRVAKASAKKRRVA